MPPTKIYSLAPNSSETRLCIDAWAKAFIQVDGGVRLCCYATPVGNINDGGLEGALNSEEAQSYRAGLLSGNLKSMCKMCGDKKIVPLRELHKAVQDWYITGRISLH